MRKKKHKRNFLLRFFFIILFFLFTVNRRRLMNSVNIERREYYRQWRAKNKDRIREYNARYWAKRVERMAQERTAGKTNY